MRRFVTRLLRTVAVVCCVFPSIAAQTSHAGPRPIGAGAFPLSFTHASASFAHRASGNEKLLTVLFYFQGSAGWLNQKTDFNWQINSSPARIDMVVGKTPIRAKYW